MGFESMVIVTAEVGEIERPVLKAHIWKDEGDE
jgi:hypothetical protein